MTERPNLTDTKGQPIQPENADAAKLEVFSTTSVIPEGGIRLPDLTIGGKTAKQVMKLIDSTRGVNIYEWPRGMYEDRDFTTLEQTQTISLILATPRAMNLPGIPTSRQIYKRADELNWDLVPAETAAYLAVAMKDQPLEKPLYMGMKTIIDADGDSAIFVIRRDRGEGVWVDYYLVSSDNLWRPEDQLVFSPRKP